MKKTIIVALIALSAGLSACSTSYRHYAHKTRNYNPNVLGMNDTVKVTSPFEAPSYFTIVSPADERGRFGVYDLQTGVYTLLSGRGMEKVSQ